MYIGFTRAMGKGILNFFFFFIKLGYRDTEKTKRFWGHGCCNKYEC